MQNFDATMKKVLSVPLFVCSKRKLNMLFSNKSLKMAKKVNLKNRNIPRVYFDFSVRKLEDIAAPTPHPLPCLLFQAWWPSPAQQCGC